MSYILEALKKAQAERQLGSAPTIHALPIQAAPAPLAGTGRTPLWIALGAGMLLAAAAGVMWSGALAPAPAPAPAPALLPEPVAVVQPAMVAAPVPAPAVVVHAPPAPAPVVVSKPRPVPVVTAPPAPKLAVEPVVVASAPEEVLPYARDLPEALRRDLPQVVFGGYMYSKNPADRLLLIDKVLRHEGEEVAPGLMLEKLLPKAAVMNYRGTRYRVGY
ncbi:MAG: general secretion pathway protein GspB [Pseudomonadota bacterium]